MNHEVIKITDAEYEKIKNKHKIDKRGMLKYKHNKFRFVNNKYHSGIVHCLVSYSMAIDPEPELLIKNLLE